MSSNTSTASGSMDINQPEDQSCQQPLLKGSPELIISNLPEEDIELEEPLILVQVAKEDITEVVESGADTSKQQMENILNEDSLILVQVPLPDDSCDEDGSQDTNKKKYLEDTSKRDFAQLDDREENLKPGGEILLSADDEVVPVSPPRLKARKTSRRGSRNQKVESNHSGSHHQERVSDAGQKNIAFEDHAKSETNKEPINANVNPTCESGDPSNQTTSADTTCKNEQASTHTTDENSKGGIKDKKLTLCTRYRNESETSTETDEIIPEEGVGASEDQEDPKESVSEPPTKHPRSSVIRRRPHPPQPRSPRQPEDSFLGSSSFGSLSVKASSPFSFTSVAGSAGRSSPSRSVSFNSPTGLGPSGLATTAVAAGPQTPIGPTSWTIYQQQRQQAGPVASGLSRLRSAASASNRERSHSTVSNPYLSSHPYRTLRSGNM